MKILIPVEVPEGCNHLSMNIKASSSEESKIMDYDYGTSEIWEFARSWKLFEGKVLNNGLL